MIFSNADKSKHGANAQINLESILKLCVKKNYITNYVKEFRIGKAGYSNREQFYAPFMIEFSDGDKWILFSTTSLRTDRVKGQQWDAVNIKEIESSVTTAVLVFPDSVSDKEKSEFERQKQKYFDRYEYSAIDTIMSQDALSNAIEAKALEKLSTGQIKDIQGRSFEERVALVIASGENIVKWKTQDQTKVGFHYELFMRIVSALKLDPYCVEGISAVTHSTELTKLPSGGNPKTDILIKVLNRGKEETYTISCKRSSETSVSVHQYTADTFADVLCPSDSNLRRLLNLFQNAGNMRDMGEENCVALEAALKPYRMKLALWVLGGIGGDGNPNIHWATHLLTYQNKDSSISIHTIHDYCEILFASGVSGNFGTPFSWTYPSKRRGESIQLKCKII